MATANLLQTSVSGGTQNALSLQGDGVFFPKASTASRLALTLTTTDKGFIVYDTTDNNIYFWNGAAWESIPGSGDAGANGSVQYNDNGIVSGATNFVWDKVNGRVGIGTASPNNTLAVRGSQDAGIEINSADSNSSRLITAYDPANTRFYINSTLSGSGTTIPLAFLIQNSEVARFNTTGNLAFANGKGIDFSANNPDPAGRTSELLNDYEEGTWVPTLTFATPGTLAVTYSTRTGNYIKVGNLVTARYAITINPAGFVKGTASGGLQITGLPFASSGTGTQYVDLAANLTDITSGTLAISYPSASIIYFEQTQVSGIRVIRSSAGVDASNFAATNTGFISLNVVLTYTV